MGDTSRVVFRLGWSAAVTALALALSACADGGEPPRTDPSALNQPVARCPQPVGDDARRLPVWDLYVVEANWETLHEDVGADVEVPAQLCIGGRLSPIDLELQGTSGRLRDKKSFKLKLKRDHALSEVGFEDDGDASIDKVFLRAVWIDHSMIREAVAFDLWRQMGHKAPRTSYANLRINGDYWGLYTVVEPVDKDYIERNGYPAGGQLYKATRKHGSRADFAPGRNLVKAFEDKTDKGSESRADLARLMAALQTTPLDEESFEREIDPVFSLDAYIDRMVWLAFTRNGDAVAQNFYLYNAPMDGQDFWYQIPWDSDLCMGANWRDRDVAVPADQSLLLDGGNHFGRRLTQVPGIRERYRDRFLEVMDTVLTAPVVLGFIEEHAERVRHDLAQDQQRWQRIVPPDEAFEVIRNFVAERPGLLRRGLEAMFAPGMEVPISPPDSIEEEI